jgi:membrane protein DedA with SNARE-associated domain
VLLLVGLEGVGIPVPGETALVSAAIVAGTSRELDIGLVIAAALVGAAVGDNLGFWLGRGLGSRLLRRYGRHIGLDDERQKLGHYLFRRYGGWVIAGGRFAAVLRTLAPFLAGANRMAWPRFFVFNASGGLLWSVGTGTAGYLFGHVIHRLVWPAGVGLGILTVLAIAIFYAWLRRHYRRLLEEALREYPEPLG